MIYENVKCPYCKGTMIARKSLYGHFWGCAQYPKCTGTRNSEGYSREEVESLKSESDEGEDVRWDR